MFTGLVRELGSVVSLRATPEGAVLKIKAPEISKGSAIGDSVSVNGVCLTVTEVSGEVLSFDLSHETLKSTNLRQLKTGSPVNLEPSLRPVDPLGGHLVTG
ncbi:MAG: riboflavin synthase, partial [Nitrospirae bacterium]